MIREIAFSPNYRYSQYIPQRFATIAECSFFGRRENNRVMIVFSPFDARNKEIGDEKVTGSRDRVGGDAQRG